MRWQLRAMAAGGQDGTGCRTRRRRSPRFPAAGQAVGGGAARAADAELQRARQARPLVARRRAAVVAALQRPPARLPTFSS